MEVSPKMKIKANCRQQTKPLHGYSFYIDVWDEQDEGEAVEILAGKIVSLGGNVRRTLSHKVLYFITSRDERRRAKIRRSTRFMKQNETRAKKKLKNVSVFKKVSPVISTVDRAKKLGLNIFTIDKVTKWLTEIERRRLPLSPKNTKQYGEIKSENVEESRFIDDDELQSLQSLTHFKFFNKNNDEKLLPPFIKIEDKEKHFEPQYIELTSFPSICFETSMPRSPFQKLELNGTAINSGGNMANGELAPCNSGNQGPKTISSTSNYSKSGYCDFCECFFRYRDRHIQTKKHQFNIPFENFKKLDNLIMNGGSFDDFLTTILKKKLSQEVLDTMERKKELSDFLKTFEGKKKAREFFSKDLNGFVEYTGRRRSLTGMTPEKKVIR